MYCLQILPWPTVSEWEWLNELLGDTEYEVELMSDSVHMYLIEWMWDEWDMRGELVSHNTR